MRVSLFRFRPIPLPAALVPAFVLLLGGLSGAHADEPIDSAIPPAAAASPRTRTLEACVETALQNNHRRPASRFAVAIAEAQHRQALSGYWPQVQLKAAYQRMDEAPNFLFPSTVTGVPAQTITTDPSTALVTIPAGVLGPAAVQLPVSVPSQTIRTPAQAFPVPAQDVKLMDPDSVVGSASLTWLLIDGGLRNGLRTQAQGLVDAMKEEARRTDLEIVDSVTRFYYGAILARQLHTLGTDTLARMEATQRITETMYQGGGGTVKKTDYLESKVTVETLRALVAQLWKNQAMAEAALANTMGMSWQEQIVPAEREIPFAPVAVPLEALVDTAYEFSPDWKRLEAGLRAADGAIQTARSGRAPKIALTGDLHHVQNDYTAGIATARNKSGWSLGLGLELPLFDGFLTRHRIAEARARLEQMKAQRFLLREGIGLQIKDAVLGLNAAQQAFQATLDARTAAEENRDLNTRAYEHELVETEKVIRAQLTEALMTAQHLKTRYDHVTLRSQLSVLVGTEWLRRLNAAP